MIGIVRSRNVRGNLAFFGKGVCGADRPCELVTPHIGRDTLVLCCQEGYHRLGDRDSLSSSAFEANWTMLWISLWFAYR